MIQPVILEKLEELPEFLQIEVLHYIEFLIEKHAKKSLQEQPPKKRRVAGTMKGMFVLPLPDDFDEPLEDMKEYEVWLLRKKQLLIYQLQGAEYKLQEKSLYFPEIQLKDTVAQCLQIAYERNTNAAIRNLKQRLENR